AARRLTGDGLSVRLLNMRTAKPIDEEEILETAARTRLLVTVEDHFSTGGLASIVSEVLTRHGTAARTLSISLGDRWFRPALLRRVLEAQGLRGHQLAAGSRTAREACP